MLLDPRHTGTYSYNGERGDETLSSLLNRLQSVIIWLGIVPPVLTGSTMILLKLFTPFTECVPWYYVCLPFYQLPFGIATLYMSTQKSCL